MTSVKLRLSPPWVTTMNEIKQLFGEDPQIKIEYDNENRIVSMYVDDGEKAEAIRNILPCWLGDLAIHVVPANGDRKSVPLSTPAKTLFDMAFKGNPVYSFSYAVEGVFSNVITYVVFKNKVVQFFNDNLNDIYGNKTTLYQEIAADIFTDQNGVFFCTDVLTEADKRKWI